MRLRYWLRRAAIILATYDNRACTLRSCPEARVGFSHWCREHTDQILEHRPCPEMVTHFGGSKLGIATDDSKFCGSRWGGCPDNPGSPHVCALHPDEHGIHVCDCGTATQTSGPT